MSGKMNRALKRQVRKQKKLELYKVMSLVYK